MYKIQQEIILTFRDESGDLVAIGEQNGSTKFHHTTKMIKDDVAELLMENNMIEPKPSKPKEKV